MLTCSVKNRLNFASGLAMGFEMITNQAASITLENYLNIYQWTIALIFQQEVRCFNGN